jgi:hypothetical protein
MRPVLPLTLVQKMDTVTNTRQILLLTMLEAELKTGHAITRLQLQQLAILLRYHLLSTHTYRYHS